MTNHDSPARPAAPSTMTSNRPRQCHNKLNPAPRSAIAPCCIETQRPTSIVSCGLVIRGVLRGPSADPGVTAVLLEPRIRGVYHLVCHGEILWLGEQSMPDQRSTSVQHLASELDSLFQQVNRYGHRVCLRRWLLYWSSQRRADAFLRRKYVDSPPHQSLLDSRTLPILACKVSLPPKSSRLNEHASQYLPICLALLSPGACVGGTQGPKALKCVTC